MKTAAAITALAVVGSFAAGQGARLPVAPDSPTIPAGNLPPMHGLPIRPTGDLSAPYASLQMGADCPPVEVEEWFAPTPHLVECSETSFTSYSDSTSWVNSLICTETGAADVNGDGVSDHFISPSDMYQFVSISSSGQEFFPPGTSSLDLIANTVAHAGASTRIGLRRIPLVQKGIGAWCASHLPIPENCALVISWRLASSAVPEYPHREGWRDMDSDGDLDYVCKFRIINYSSSESVYGQLWFENIGYEKSQPPLAADLNRDGSVDGIDLGLLLAAWGTNS